MIYEVSLANGGAAYMRVDGIEGAADKRFVVVVDAARFLALWRADPYGYHADVSSQTPATWPQDAKYAYAVEGFAPGKANPVPLAEVACEISEQRRDVRERAFFVFTKVVRVERIQVPYVAFQNGITRTIWLLTNGAQAFPVKVESEAAAQLLQRHAGLGEPLQSIGALMATV